MSKKASVIYKILSGFILLFFVYRIILGIRAGQHIPMPLFGCVLLILVGLYRIFAIRKSFQGSDEERKTFNKIVIRSVILGLIIMVVFVTVVVLVKLKMG